MVVVIDPGPDDPSHLQAIEERLHGIPVGAVLVTHSHPDHLPLAETLARRHDARVAVWPDLGDGDVVRLGKVAVTAVHTPGHSPDHLCFWLDDGAVAFTGDLVLGQGSTMITYPDGDMAAYLASLDRLEGLRPRTLFPGHWDPIVDPVAKIDEYRRHRLEREEQIIAAVRERPADASQLTERVYAREVGSDEKLMIAAEMTLRAHLRKLVDDGTVREEDGIFSARG